MTNEIVENAAEVAEEINDAVSKTSGKTRVVVIGVLFGAAAIAASSVFAVKWYEKRKSVLEAEEELVGKDEATIVETKPVEVNAKAPKQTPRTDEPAKARS